MEIKGQYIELHIIRELNRAWEFLLLRRAENEMYPGVWQMVSGKIKTGESAAQAARREMLEETGLTPMQMWTVPIVNSFYSSPDDAVNLVPVFAARVPAEGAVMLSDEHSEFRWVSAETAKALLAWNGQRNAVDIILQYITKQDKHLVLLTLD